MDFENQMVIAASSLRRLESNDENEPTVTLDKQKIAKNCKINFNFQIGKLNRFIKNLPRN